MYDERFGRVDPSRPSVGRDVNDLCRAGDAKATEVIHDAGFALGASLGSLANILDPEVIVLSGGVIHQGPDWRSQTWKDSVHEGYASQALDPLQNTPILIGSLEGDAPLIGAAEHLHCLVEVNVSAVGASRDNTPREAVLRKVAAL